MIIGGILGVALGCDAPPSSAPIGEGDASVGPPDDASLIANDASLTADASAVDPDASLPACAAPTAEIAIEGVAWCEQERHVELSPWSVGTHPGTQRDVWSANVSVVCLHPTPLPNAPSFLTLLLSQWDAPQTLAVGETSVLDGAHMNLFLAPEVAFTLPARPVAADRWGASHGADFYLAVGQVRLAQISPGADGCLHLHLSGDMELTTLASPAWTEAEAAPLAFELRARIPR